MSQHEVAAERALRKSHADLLAALREARGIIGSLRDYVAEGGSSRLIGAHEAITEADVFCDVAHKVIAAAEGK